MSSIPPNVEGFSVVPPLRTLNFFEMIFFPLIFLNFDAFQASLSRFTSLRLLPREKPCFQVRWQIHKTRAFCQICSILVYVVDLSKKSTLFFHFLIKSANIFFFFFFGSIMAPNHENSSFATSIIVYI